MKLNGSTKRQWTEYRSLKRRRETLHVSLNPRGVFLVNERGYELLGRPGAAVLLYDEKYQVIGLRLVGANEPNSFPFAARKGYSSRVVYANGFCGKFKIKPRKTIIFPDPPFDENEGILELDLHLAVEAKPVR